MSIRSKQVVVWFSLMAVLGAAGAAWACTSQPRLLMVSPVRSPNAETVKISGEGVVAEQVITIRWNTLNGPKLAEVTPSRSGSFFTNIVVPDVAPGIYFILVETPAGVGRTAFEVTARAAESSGVAATSPAPATRADLWQGFGSSSDALSPEAGLGERSSRPTGDSMMTGAFLAITGFVGLAAFGTMAARRRRAGSAGAE